MFYKFSAMKENSDEIVSSELEAKDETAALAQIKRQFAVVVSLEKVTEVQANNKGHKKISWLTLQGHRITIGEKAMFFRKLYMLISAGMTNVDAISVLKENEVNFKLKSVLMQIFNSVKKGQSLSVAVSEFPKIFGGNVIDLLQIGDETGHMADALNSITEYMDEVATSRKKLATALAYPIFLLVSFLLVFFIVVLYCVPRFERAFEPIIRRGGLPLVSRIIFATSNFICGHYFICLLCILLLISLVFYKSHGRWQDKFYFLPVVRNSLLAEAMRNLSFLISSNIPALNATTIVAAESNCSHVKEIFLLAAEALAKGEPIDEALGNHLSKLDKNLLSVGITGAKLGEVCRLISLQYKIEAEVLQKKFLSLLEPTLVLLIGLLVALVAFGIYLPCIKMIEEISM